MVDFEDTLVFLACLTIIYLWAFYYFNGTQREAEPPLLRGWIPFLGHAITFGKSPMSFLQSCRKKYGEIFTVVLAGKKITFVMDAADFHNIFKRPSEFSFDAMLVNITHDAFKISHELSREMFEEPVLSKIHRAINTSLQGKSLEMLTIRMHSGLLEFLATIGDINKYKHDLWALVSRAVFSAGTRCILGDGYYTEKNYLNFTKFDKRFPLLVGGFAVPGIAQIVKELSESLHAGRSNICSLIPSREALIESITSDKDEIHRSNIMVLWASQSNTVSAAFWALFYVLKHPEVFRKVMEEIQEFDSQLREGVITRDDLKKMVWLESCVDETLRLTNSIMPARLNLADSNITISSTGQTFSLRKGDQIGMASVLNYYDPEIFSDPLEFKMDRFLQTDDGYCNIGNKAKAAFLPWGAGKTICPGRLFAKIEMKLTVATMLSLFDISIDPGCTLAPDFAGRFGIGVPPPTTPLPFRIAPKRKRVSCA